MAGIHNGPIPTTLTLLADLRKYEKGEKVRFLGCVTKYSTKTAILTLEHNHPNGNASRAFVDVKLLLDTLKSNETQIGEWVNVIGYITQRLPNSANHSNRASCDVQVQAIVLWSSGPLNLEGYEKTLDQQNVDGLSISELTKHRNE